MGLAQLVERSHTTPEVRGSIPVIDKLLLTVNCIEKTKITKKRLVRVNLKKSFSFDRLCLPRCISDLSCQRVEHFTLGTLFWQLWHRQLSSSLWVTTGVDQQVLVQVMTTWTMIWNVVTSFKRSQCWDLSTHRDSMSSAYSYMHNLLSEGLTSAE